MEPVRGDMDKVHVRADRREGLVPAKGLALRIDIDLLHILHEFHEMPGARIQEIPAQHGRNPLHVNHLDAYGPKAVLGPFENLACMQPVRRHEQEHAAGSRLDAQVIGKSHDAAPAVPAHHPAGPIGVVELHGEIDPGIPGAQDHQPVGLVFLAQRLDARHLTESLAAVYDHEVVAGSGKMIDCLHNRPLMISPSSFMPGSIFSSATKEKLSRMVLRWLPSRKKNEPAT